MALLLNNVTTTDKVSDNELETANAVGLSILIANAAVIVNFKKKPLAGGSNETAWGPDLLLSPQTAQYRNVSGFRCKSAVAGMPAQVVAVLSEPSDPEALGANPYTANLSPTGIVTPPIVTSVLDTARVNANAVFALASGGNPAVALAAAYAFNTNAAIFGARGVTTGFFVQANGTYLVAAYAVFQFNAAGTRYISVRKNLTGTDEFADVRSASPTLVTEILITDEVTLNAGEFVELYVFQDSGVALNVQLGRLTLTKIQ